MSCRERSIHENDSYINYNACTVDLGEMASRLQRFVNRLVKQHLEKPSSAYEVDEDFRVSRGGETVEKKFRPKRGASSRARDTLRKAMDDDEFEVSLHYRSRINLVLWFHQYL